MGFLIDPLIYIDAHPWIRGPLNFGLVLMTGLLALAPLWKRGNGGGRSWWQRSWLFFAFLGVSLFACRYAIVFYEKYINIDEAMLVAQAVTYESHPIPWRDVDPTTSGPLNGYAVLWGVPFGIHPGYISARMAGLFCILGMLIFLYLAGRRIAGEIAARLTVLPVYLFLCFTAFPDYIHYTSEQVSLLLIGMAVCFLERMQRATSTIWSIIAFGIVVGLLPFAKLQSALPGAALGLSAIWLLVMRRRGPLHLALAKCGILALAAVFPGALLLTIVACTGALYDFWASYIEMASYYGPHFSSTSDNIGVKSLMFYEIFCPNWGMSMPTYLMLGLGGCVGGGLVAGGIKASRIARDWYVFSVLLWLTMLATILFTNFRFLHYHFFFLPALILIALASLRILKTQIRRHSARQLKVVFYQAAISGCIVIVALIAFLAVYSVELTTDEPPVAAFGWMIVPLLILMCAFALAADMRPRANGTLRLRRALITCFLIFFIAPFLLVAFKKNPFRGLVGDFVVHRFDNMDMVILQVRPPGGRLAIWGWAPQYSAETHTVLGTRDSNTRWAIEPCPLQDYFRQRFLRDMLDNRPELFLDSTGPWSFTFKNPQSEGFECFPDLQKLIAKHYRKIYETDGMRLFVRMDTDLPDMPEHER